MPDVGADWQPFEGGCRPIFCRSVLQAAAELATLLFALSVGFTFVNAALFPGTEIRPQAVLGAAMIVAAIFLTQTARPKDAR